MAFHTQPSLSGFIASDPQQSVTEHGDTRFYVRVGQAHFRREDDGGFTELEPSFPDLVAYRATAERALTRFSKGDSFVAEGYVRMFQVERDGEAIQREEFVARKIGHDLARTNHEVDRAHPAVKTSRLMRARMASSMARSGRSRRIRSIGPVERR
ncbi:single-stranded DNA-binding protein [Marisediminicola antarctica]|uniref:Single-stranded DNA-binding protein n=1 Tax=Marisediminicola antarctica TaxID=674079 RepID=A0A7L5AG13_9MICO|nr:single-stranded DNA-binding protein [Marisediminicola antarctica]QHO69443.1 single-stranded DNA-binding protein [Marisediminicola antarctica]